MIIISLDELRVIAKQRGTKDHQKKSGDDLIKILSEPKTKINFCRKEQKTSEKILINQDICYNIPHNTEKIRAAQKSKHNFKHENQLILLTVTDVKKWHCLNVKSLSALLKGTTSNNKGDFY